MSHFLIEAQGEFDAMAEQGFFIFLLFIALPVALIVAIGLAIAGGKRRRPRCARCGRILDRGNFRCPVCHPGGDGEADRASEGPPPGGTLDRRADEPGHPADGG